MVHSSTLQSYIQCRSSSFDGKANNIGFRLKSVLSNDWGKKEDHIIEYNKQVSILKFLLENVGPNSPNQQNLAQSSLE